MSEQLNQNTIDLQTLLDIAIALPREGSGVSSYYTGASVPDNSLGEDGDLFFILEE